MDGKQLRNTSKWLGVPVWLARLYVWAAIILVPWTVLLAIGLPSRHASVNWNTSWAGLDIALAGCLLLTGLLSLRRSRAVIMTATAAATLVLVDAWFDVLSAHPGYQLLIALLEAVLIELPLALISLHIAVSALNSTDK